MPKSFLYTLHHAALTGDYKGQMDIMKMESMRLDNIIRGAHLNLKDAWTDFKPTLRASERLYEDQMEDAYWEMYNSRWPPGTTRTTRPGILDPETGGVYQTPDNAQMGELSLRRNILFYELDHERNQLFEEGSHDSEVLRIGRTVRNKMKDYRPPEYKRKIEILPDPKRLWTGNLHNPDGTLESLSEEQEEAIDAQVNNAWNAAIMPSVQHQPPSPEIEHDEEGDPIDIMPQDF
jgi:hypothetical protein